MTLHGPIGSPNPPPEPAPLTGGDETDTQGGSEAAAAAGAIERLTTSEVPAWRFLAALVALVWIYRGRVLLPAVLVGAVVLVLSQAASSGFR